MWGETGFAPAGRSHIIIRSLINALAGGSPKGGDGVVKRRVLLLLGLCGVGGALLTAPLGAQQTTGLPPVGPVPIGPAPDRGPLPALTADQAKTIAGVIASDAHLSKLLSGRSFSTTKIGPWTREDGTLAGAVARLEFPEPVDVIDEEWTTLDAPEPNAAGPIIRMQRLTVRNMQAMTVLVDLDSRQIVSEAPAPQRAPALGAPEPSAANRLSVELPPGASIPAKPSKD
jgi:hypothetical protein